MKCSNPIRTLLAPALLVTAALALGLAPPVRAEQEDDAAELETRVFQIHFKEVSDIFLLIEDRVSAAGSIWLQPKLKTISVTDTAENLEQIERLIADYDLPPRNVEVSFRLILASTEGTEGHVQPPRIRDIIRKIDEVTTRWSNYRLLGSGTVIGTEGERSVLRLGDGYRIGFLIEYAGERQGVVTVRLADFSLERLEEGPGRGEKGGRYVPLLSTSLNLNRDRLYILGASRSEVHDRALFVTISASTL